ncbi:GNAT family N-acetyltransferase [Gynuella sp.]|uniref:GNAT family N-acetyltransferase n=1 Tax=Gynuella sp. TaxID=2969146 RepID=UPI003D0D9BA3
MESKYLRYKVIAKEDTHCLSEIMMNSEHMRFSTQFSSISECESYIGPLANQWENLGFGCWTIVEKISNEVIGWGGIVLDESDPDWGPELIYYISPKKCGNGYASEVSEFSCNYAFSVANIPKVAAFAHPENYASNKVIRKTGFQFVRYLKAMNRNYYELAAST